MASLPSCILCWITLYIRAEALTSIQGRLVERVMEISAMMSPITTIPHKTDINTIQHTSHPLLPTESRAYKVALPPTLESSRSDAFIFWHFFTAAFAFTFVSFKLKYDASISGIDNDVGPDRRGEPFNITSSVPLRLAHPVTFNSGDF